MAHPKIKAPIIGLETVRANFTRTRTRIVYCPFHGIMDYKYYTYLLCYSDGTPFYVGKGSRSRVFSHETLAIRGDKSAKSEIIRQIWYSGKEVVKKIVCLTNDEKVALQEEANWIKYIGPNNLVNINLPSCNTKTFG